VPPGIQTPGPATLDLENETGVLFEQQTG